MRTTLTLEDDLAAKLRDEARRSRKPFKQLLNDCLRIGLKVRSQAASAPPFKIKARSLGEPGFNYDKVWEIIERAEGPYYR